MNIANVGDISVHSEPAKFAKPDPGSIQSPIQEKKNKSTGDEIADGTKNSPADKTASATDQKQKSRWALASGFSSTQNNRG